MTSDTSQPEERALLRADAAAFRDWLLTAAFPVWWERGADHARGGFHEKLEQDGTPADSPRRARVQPRQIYSYAAAGRLGWAGPWREAMETGLGFYLQHYPRPDGLMRALVSADGAPLDDKATLYDQAFALFGLATAAETLPELRAEFTARAEAILTRLRDFAVAGGGFREPDGDADKLESNPHMHMFEAALAWRDLTGDAAWSALADEIAELCLSRFIDADTGALREFFDGAWRPRAGVEGRIVEPGHQFEWCWLLLKWGRPKGREDALRAAERLAAIGAGPGHDPVRGVANQQLLDDFTVHDPVSRLWTHTERIKAGVALAQAGLGANIGAERQARLGLQALTRYFDTPIRGLYRDKMLADGSFVEEPAPASSLYHIVLAAEELLAFTG